MVLRLGRLQVATDDKDIHVKKGHRYTATFILNEGIHPKVVQERLGHSSISITLDTYSHVIPSMQEEIADKIEDLLR